MTSASLLAAEDDTQRVTRSAAFHATAPNRLAEMDLDPPSGPVPADVLAYFEAALDREARRRAA